MTLKIATVSLLVDSYERGIAFYRDVLRLELAQDTSLGGGRRWVVITGAGGARLLLAQADGPAQVAAIGNQTGGRVGFFLETDDFGRDYARLVEAGVKFLEHPRHEAYGSVAVFEDPFGNKWDLIEPKS
jgi:catechol 2,3-dioxygenase-like lactoylglutathione lyase family enzyme